MNLSPAPVKGLDLYDRIRHNGGGPDDHSLEPPPRLVMVGAVLFPGEGEPMNAFARACWFLAGVILAGFVVVVPALLFDWPALIFVGEWSMATGALVLFALLAIDAQHPRP